MSITTERRRLAEVGLVMREREDWGATFDDYDQPRPVEVAGLLVGHIAVVNDPGDLLGTEDQVMRNIERIGIARFPNTGYSYNGAGFNSGRLYEGQPLERRGAHTVNDRRRSSCTMAGCPSRGDSLTAPSWNNNVNARALVAPQMPGVPCPDKQVVSFARWGAALKLAGFATAAARWHGHRCFAAKDCPGNEVWLRLDDIADLTADYVRAGHVGDQPKEDDDMTPDEAATLARVDRNLAVVAANVVNGTRYQGPANTRALVSRDLQPIRAALSELTGRQVTDVDEAQIARELAPILLPAIAAELGDFTQEQVEAALRNVLGGLDEGDQ